jgi:hypothetical protein
MIKNFIKNYLVALFIFTFLMSPIVLVFANHAKGTYPSVGHLWMSTVTGYAGLIYTSSDNCNSQETGAYARIKNSTEGYSEMPDWSNGIDMRQYTCDGTWNNYTDIVIEYLNHPDSGGENHDTLNSSSYCSFWGESHPCGVRSTVHVDETWWNNASNDSRERLIMHETGHSFGLSHHCSEDAIMNDGTSGCNGGKWTSVMEYKSTDRTGIDNVY